MSVLVHAKEGSIEVHIPIEVCYEDGVLMFKAGDLQALSEMGSDGSTTSYDSLIWVDVYGQENHPEVNGDGKSICMKK